METSQLLPSPPHAWAARGPVVGSLGMRRRGCPGSPAGMQSVTARPLITEQQCREGSGTKGPLCGSNGAVHSCARASQGGRELRGGSARAGGCQCADSGALIYTDMNPWGAPRPPPRCRGALLPAQLLARLGAGDGLSSWEDRTLFMGSSNRLQAARVGAGQGQSSLVPGHRARELARAKALVTTWGQIKLGESPHGTRLAALVLAKGVSSIHLG